MAEKVTLERVMAAVEADDNIGFCLACGTDQLNCEPDMRNGKCESCGAHKVFGAEDLLLRMA